MVNPWVRKVPWRMAWQPTPVFSPGESHGQRNVVVHKVAKTRLKQLNIHISSRDYLWPSCLENCERINLSHKLAASVNSSHRKLTQIFWALLCSSHSVIHLCCNRTAAFDLLANTLCPLPFQNTQNAFPGGLLEAAPMVITRIKWVNDYKTPEIVPGTR